MPDGNTPPDLIRSLVDSLAEEVLGQLELTKRIQHPGEGGRARENIVATFLRRILPASLGLSTGFVIDASGGISRQVDLIVHRLAHYPFFEIGGVRHFPVESVVAVLENKASMASSRGPCLSSCRLWLRIRPQPDR